MVGSVQCRHPRSCCWKEMNVVQACSTTIGLDHRDVAWPEMRVFKKITKDDVSLQALDMHDIMIGSKMRSSQSSPDIIWLPFS